MLLFDHCLSLMKSCKYTLLFSHFLVNEKRKCTSNITMKPEDLVYNFWNWKECSGQYSVLI